MQHTEPWGKCPRCDSEDHWMTRETAHLQGVHISVRREYCNRCGSDHDVISVSIDGGEVQMPPAKKREPVVDVVADPGPAASAWAAGIYKGGRSER